MWLVVVENPVLWVRVISCVFCIFFLIFCFVFPVSVCLLTCCKINSLNTPTLLTFFFYHYILKLSLYDIKVNFKEINWARKLQMLREKNWLLLLINSFWDTCWHCSDIRKVIPIDIINFLVHGVISIIFPASSWWYFDQYWKTVQTKKIMKYRM